MASQTPFSVVIICRDEARTITSCVQAAARVSDDIVVVDSGSVDGSQSLAEQAGARVLHKSWQGYGANKNYGTQQAKNDWIISVDADEVLNEDLIMYLSTFRPEHKTVYQLNSLVYFMGQWVKHSGWFPVWKNRIYNRKELRWNDAAVHEDLTPLQGMKVKQLPGLLLHYSYRDKADHQQRMLHYAKLKAVQWHRVGKTPSLAKRLLGPAFKWFKSYIIKQGWRDGAVGRYIAKSNAQMIRLALKEYDLLQKA